MYAITESSYRAVTAEMPLATGEVRVEEIHASLLRRIECDKMKAERSMRLRATDWTQVPDAPLTALEKAAYQTYRQALRDLPSLPGFPDVPWPTVPSLGSTAAEGTTTIVRPIGE